VPHRAVVTLQPRGTRPPIFGVGGGGDLGWCYQTLSKALGAEQPFYGLTPPGLDDSAQVLHDVADLADYFATAIREFYPNGPLVIIGYCAGGAVAFELARRLLARGGNVALLVLLAAPYPSAYRFTATLKRQLELIASRISYHKQYSSSMPGAQRIKYIASRLLNYLGHPSRDALAAVKDPVIARVNMIQDAVVEAVRRYHPQHFDGRIALILTNENYKDSDDRPLEWQHHAVTVDILTGPTQCNHDTMLTDFAPATARLIEKACRSIGCPNVQPKRLYHAAE
jgi:thioesterase domain-containing protein